VLAAYAVPAAAVWTPAGLLAGLVPAGHAVLAVIAGYAAYYGLIETTGRAGLPPPGRSWQVPSRWVDRAPGWRRILIWGSVLGPGFATRNPYAGFGLLPLVVAAAGSPLLGVALAALLGFLHGAGRAAALLRDARHAADADYLLSVMAAIRWRTLDGFALLLVAGAAAATMIVRS
jgi:hypothetical protein